MGGGNGTVLFILIFSVDFCIGNVPFLPPDLLSIDPYHVFFLIPSPQTSTLKTRQSSGPPGVSQI